VRIQPKVCVALVNWNSFDDTTEAVESLLKSDYKRMRILVVDNNSSDNSIPRLKKLFGRKITYLALRENTGVTGGSNAAFNWSIRKGFKYTLIGNADIVVDKSAVRFMVERAESDRRIGIIDGKIYRGVNTHTIYSAGAKRNWGISYGMRGVCLDDRIFKFDKPERTFWAVGTFALYRNEMIKHIGGFDEEFFVCGEDIELGSRVSKSGWKVFYEPRAKVWHKVGGAFGWPFSKKRWYYGSRSVVKLVQKGYWSGLLLPFGIIATVAPILSAVILLKPNTAYWGVLGVIDGLKGVSGKSPRF
jgi:GT2 family glycosyltransferase